MLVFLVGFVTVLALGAPKVTRKPNKTIDNTNCCRTPSGGRETFLRFSFGWEARWGGFEFRWVFSAEDQGLVGLAET